MFISAVIKGFLIDRFVFERMILHHVIDRAYVRTYVCVNGLYRWGRGDYQKEGRGVSGGLGKSTSFTLDITFTIWSTDSCQNRIATDQYPMTTSRAHVSTHRGDVIYLEAVR